jgi:hypothetical protein
MYVRASRTVRNVAPSFVGIGRMSLLERCATGRNMAEIDRGRASDCLMLAPMFSDCERVCAPRYRPVSVMSPCGHILTQYEVQEGGDQTPKGTICLGNII